MSKEVAINSNNREPYLASTFEEFILWSALPRKEQIAFGIETQKEFAAHYEVREATLSAWKDRPEYRMRVRALRDKWAFDKTGRVIEAIYKTALGGNPFSQKLWLQVFEGFSEKTETKETKRVELGINDIRFIIESLPEPLRSEHHANIRKLINDSMSLRHAGRIENVVRPATTIEGDLQERSDIDAQVVSNKGSNEVATRHTERVSSDMGRQVSTYHYQSTERWW